MLLNRREISNLQNWATQPDRKPLIIRGARQVGKSTLVRQLAETAPLALVEINFERNPELRQAFASRDPSVILTTVELLTRQSVVAGQSLLFLDEIQVAPEAIAALRYFREEMPNLHVIAAGSLLEFTLAEAQFSMPVGRVEYMHLGPLQFEDFLEAMREPALSSWLQKVSLAELYSTPLVRAVHDRYMELLRHFWIVGGLPEAVASFAAGSDFTTVGRVHQSILATYRDDFGKYSHGSLKNRIQLVFDRLPALVGRRFKYSHVSHEHRAAELATALQQLCMARVAYKVHHTSANGVPLEAEVDERNFKVLYMDVGLMCSGLHLSLLDLRREDLSLVNDGTVAEQFIGQHLLYRRAWYETPNLHYWTREVKGAVAELDYVVAQGQQIIPVEVKAGKTGTLKSLHRFLLEKHRSFGLRFNGDIPSFMSTVMQTTDKAKLQFELLSLPLYLVGQAGRLLTEHFTNPDQTSLANRQDKRPA